MLGVIYDALPRIDAYRSLSPFIPAAIAFLRSADLAALPIGILAVDGDNVFAITAEYTTKADAEGKWESHRRYLDIQLMLAGSERMGFADVDALPIETPYDVTSDVAFHRRTASVGQFLVVSPLHFAIFLPHDAHMPQLAVATSAPVRKVVVKVAVA